MKGLFTLGAWLFIIAGVAMIVAVVASGNSEMGFVLGLGITGVTFVIVGVIWLGVARFLGNLDPAKILGQAGGGASSGIGGGSPPIAGTALVTSVQDTGVILNSVNLVVNVGLQVTLPGKAPYEAQTRFVAQGRTQWGTLQPGMTVRVLVNRNDPSKVVIDNGDGAAAAPNIPDIGAILQQAGLGGLAQSMAANMGQSPQQQPAGISGDGDPVVTAGGQQFQASVRSAEDIVARGRQGFGTLEQATPTGMTAGQAKAGLPPHEADDPIMLVAFNYRVAGKALRSQIMVRVPDGKGSRLIPGGSIPIAYLPQEPETATIDWSRV